jgi:hypothetical protein
MVSSTDFLRASERPIAIRYNEVLLGQARVTALEA